MCSPRAWGWTEERARQVARVGVFPTGVGMDRRGAIFAGGVNSVPHGRGDGPSGRLNVVLPSPCSPRAWGWTDSASRVATGISVFPTGVGMDRRPAQGEPGDVSVPHGRGDGPCQNQRHEAAKRCSPRAWGWTGDCDVSLSRCLVFPTGVGMDRTSTATAGPSSRVPHGRGDGPETSVEYGNEKWCSPRAWGWTGDRPCRPTRRDVFPTGVGMDRWRQQVEGQLGGVPHGRGDGPRYSSIYAAPGTCSPRAWGWTVRQAGVRVESLVFPTGVGMDRPGAGRRMAARGVPHGRGDGPRSRTITVTRDMCSPRAWGWTARSPTPGEPSHVFPTGVGMDRPPSARWPSVLSVPHGRGDGPA